METKKIEKEASNRQKVDKLYQNYLQALKDAGIKYEIKQQSGFESIYVNKTEIARLRHKFTFSIVSKYISSNKALRPKNKNQIEKIVEEQLNNLKKA